MRKIVLLVAIVALAALAQKQPAPPPGLLCPEKTLVLYNVDWSAWNGSMVAEHAAYLVAGMKARTILSAGKTDSAISPSGKSLNGAAATFTSTNWAEVEELIKQDPYYRAGVASVASHTVWNACEPEK